MKTIYECELCGKRFEDYNECIDHEIAHICPAYGGTKARRYDNLSPNAEYPSMLHARMTNDDVVAYRFDHIVARENEKSEEAGEAVADVG